MTQILHLSHGVTVQTSGVNVTLPTPALSPLQGRSSSPCSLNLAVVVCNAFSLLPATPAPWALRSSLSKLWLQLHPSCLKPFGVPQWPCIREMATKTKLCSLPRPPLCGLLPATRPSPCSAHSPSLARQRCCLRYFLSGALASHLWFAGTSLLLPGPG